MVLDLARPLLADEIATLALLDEPVRRALYEHVARQPGDVSRDEAAGALRISRVLAAFHLDRLVKAGLLEATYRRVSGRRGPGAGRPSKFYRRSQRAVAISLPDRRYELIAQLFAQSLEDPRSVAAREVLYEVARTFGTQLGHEKRPQAGKHPSRKRMLALAAGELEALGYEPYQDRDVVRLRNCPFHQLARNHESLVCSANLSMLEGLLHGLEAHSLRADLQPEAGHCCVAIGSAV